MAASPATCPHGMLLACRLAKAEWFALLCFPSVSEKKALFICLGAWRSAAHQSYPSTNVPDATAFFRHVNHVSRGSWDPCSVLMLLVLMGQIDAQTGGVFSFFHVFLFFFSPACKLPATLRPGTQSGFLRDSLVYLLLWSLICWDFDGDWVVHKAFINVYLMWESKYSRQEIYI